ILAATARVPERTLAAVDDPWVLDRQLTAERAEHEAALAAGPPDTSLSYTRFTSSMERREQEARRAWDELGRIDRQLAKTSGLRQLRPETRRTHTALLAAREKAAEQLDAIQEQLRSDRVVAGRA